MRKRYLVAARRILGMLAVGWMVTGTATPLRAQTEAELLQKYPWGALYVPSSPLVDLMYLGSSSKAHSSSNQSGLPLLATFIRNVGGQNVLGNIAFLHIDLREMRAGYSSPRAGTGMLSPIGWSRAQVLEVARWLDRYFTQNRQLAAVIGSVAQTGSAAPTVAQVNDAWEAMQEAIENPFVSPLGAFELANDFHQSITRRPETLAQIRAASPEKFREINRFKAEFENNRTAAMRAAGGLQPVDQIRMPQIGELQMMQNVRILDRMVEVMKSETGA